MLQPPVCGMQRFDLFSALLVVSCLLATAPGCANPLEAPAEGQRATQAVPSQYDTETVSVVLPRGDAQAGRQVFLDLKCTACHRIVGETTFPEPVGGTQGPDLDHTLGLRPTSDLAAAITVPSHSMSLKTSDEVKKRLENVLLSPMGDFSRTMTVRQLVDLLAYLASLDAAK